MTLTGEQILGAKRSFGTSGTIQAINPATGEAMEPDYGGGTVADVDTACTLAEAAFDTYRALPLGQRALFLEAIADGIVALGDVLIERVILESGLPRPRIEGERGRTVGQLRLFASVVREGRFLGAIVEHALPERKPLPRPDLRSQRIPLGPVAVFGASNFPLAFSVAGGDTAAALAAGCPVVVKAHPLHLGTSELVGRVIQQAAATQGLPEGIFSLVIDDPTNAVSAALVEHPAIQAVAFTGSRRVGKILIDLAAKRSVPIPVYAEMSGINPVFLLPSALMLRAEEIARGFVDSMTLGSGQFCTKPGVVFAVAGPAFNQFRLEAQRALEAKQATTMLAPGIHRAYEHGLTQWASDKEVQSLAEGAAPALNSCSGQPRLFLTTSTHFLATPLLSDEVFGPTALLIECPSVDALLAVARSLEGQLTATLQMEDADTDLARNLLTILERKAGRILVNGFPTGVEVSYAMVHGGPYPATSEGRSTSVGAMAIDRFLRPVCYQNLPSSLLPETLQATNSLQIPTLTR